MMREIRPGFKRIVDISRRAPDSQHDTRHLECGHSQVVPKMALHPMSSRCKRCQDNA